MPNRQRRLFGLRAGIILAVLTLIFASSSTPTASAATGARHHQVLPSSPTREHYPDAQPMPVDTSSIQVAPKGRSAISETDHLRWETASALLAVLSLSASFAWSWAAYLDRQSRPRCWTKRRRGLEREISRLDPSVRDKVTTVEDTDDRTRLVYDLSIGSKFRWSRFLRIFIGATGFFTGAALGAAASFPETGGQRLLAAAAAGAAIGAIVTEVLDRLMSRFDSPAKLVGEMLRKENTGPRLRGLPGFALASIIRNGYYGHSNGTEFRSMIVPPFRGSSLPMNLGNSGATLQ